MLWGPPRGAKVQFIAREEPKMKPKPLATLQVSSQPYGLRLRRRLQRQGAGRQAERADRNREFLEHSINLLLAKSAGPKPKRPVI